MQERHTNMELEVPNKNFFFNNYILDVFLLVTATISPLVTTLILYILCKDRKLKTLVTSLALQQIKELGTVATPEKIRPVQSIECTCKIQWYTILMMGISILG